MILSGRRGQAALALALFIAGGITAARACTPSMIVVIDLRIDAVLAQVETTAFALTWRHSVTLTDVRAEYVLSGSGEIIQTAERFAAHGPGMAHDGTGWRIEGDQMVFDLHRVIDRLVLRAAPQHENRLHAGAIEIDLTQWPATPLEIRAADCKDRTP